MISTTRDDRATPDANLTDISLGQGLRALAQGEVDALIEALGDTRSRHRGIHEARKSIRRLRSIVALGDLARAGPVAQVDVDLKSLATGLSALRDAHVAVQMAGCFVRDKRKVHALEWTAVRTRLIAQRNLLLAEAMADDPKFSRRIANLARLRLAIDALAWDGIEAADIKDALERNVRTAKKAGRRAISVASDSETRHRWRRKLRRLRMQRTTLKALGSSGVCAEATQSVQRILSWLRLAGPKLRSIASTTDELGAEQDLRLLNAALKRLPADATTRLALRQLEPLLERGR